MQQFTYLKSLVGQSLFCKKEKIDHRKTTAQIIKNFAVEATLNSSCAVSIPRCLHRKYRTVSEPPE